MRDPLNPQRMWAASFGDGVYRSLDGGTTWKAYRNGLINTPARPETVLAGSGTGGIGTVQVDRQCR